MAESYFDQLLELAASIVALADVEGGLSKREWKTAKEQHDNLEAKFKEVRNEYVDTLLAAPDGQEQAHDSEAAYIEGIRATCDPSWIPALRYVSDNLLPYLKKEAGRDPRLRKAIKSIPWVLGVTSAITYFAIRFLSATPIDHVIETKEGIQERAAAVEKLLRYDDWMDTHVRRGGWLKGILLWPIEPSEAEIKGATEFASLAYDAQQISVEQFACPTIERGYENKPTNEELRYLSESADFLRGANVEWKEPPIATTVDAARLFGSC